MTRARLTRGEALDLARLHGFPLDSDFHALTSGEVEGVLAAADARGYRKPRTANGSRGRSFHAYLRRAADRKGGEA